MRIALLMISLCFCLNIQAQKSELKEKDKDIILEIMTVQEACWNAGNIDCFMEGYWKSDKLRFMGKNGVTYGWKPTLEQYKKGYPNEKAMGKLTFTVKSVEKLTRKKALVVGKWHLAKEEETEGYFSLIWEKINGEWMIVFDHSS